MKRTHFLFALALGVAGLFAAPATADHNRGPRGGGEIILYSGLNYTGEARAYYGDVETLVYDGFNDVARSIEVLGGTWTLCKDRGGEGRCRTISRSIADLDAIGLDCKLTSFYQIAHRGAHRGERGRYNGGHRGGYGGHYPSAQAGGYPVTLFTRDDFRGRAIGVSGTVNLRDIGFNNKADSLIVEQGRWIVCTRRDLRGRCEVIGRSIRNLDRLDLGEKISSIAPYRQRYSRRGWR